MFVFVVARLYCCGKHPRETTGQKQRFLLAPNCRNFSLWSAGSVALRPEVRQGHHGQGERDAALMVASKGRGTGDRGKMLIKDTAPMTSVLKASPPTASQ